MAALPSLMALYGALDPASTSDFDSRVIADVAPRYLPVSAGAAGWFGNIMELFGGEEGLPNPVSALNDIAEGRDSPEDRLTVPELSRFVYVAGALCHTPQFESMVSESGSPLARALALAGPEYNGGTEADVARGDNLLQLLYAELGSARDRDRVFRMAVVQRLLSANVGAVPACIPSTQGVDGYECVVIDTSFGRSDIYLQKLKDVVDPLNWHRNYPHAFCEMDQQNPEIYPDGWSRVLETVSLGCQQGLPRLVTPLKYYKSEPTADQATLQYELDTGPVFGDGQVKVDRGFIKMQATGNPGVWVRTRKIVHIDGLSPAAQAMFVCPSGYALQASEMIFGNATNPPPDTVPWQISPPPTTTTAPVTGAPTTGTQAPPTGAQAPTPGGSVASTITQIWIDCLKDLADKNLQLSTKWRKNQLTVDDLVAYTQDVGGEIASAPWRLIQALNRPPADGTPGGNA
jgi:hypothetical protein